MFITSLLLVISAYHSNNVSVNTYYYIFYSVILRIVTSIIASLLYVITLIMESSALLSASWSRWYAMRLAASFRLRGGDWRAPPGRLKLNQIREIMNIFDIEAEHWSVKYFQYTGHGETRIKYLMRKHFPTSNNTGHDLPKIWRDIQRLSGRFQLRKKGWNSRRKLHSFACQQQFYCNLYLSFARLVQQVRWIVRLSFWHHRFSNEFMHRNTQHKVHKWIHTRETRHKFMINNSSQ